MAVVDPFLLAKVAKSLAQPVMHSPKGGEGSLFLASASAYGLIPMDVDATVPSGVDPAAAELFEAIVEAAYLVATAGGPFDAQKQKAFESVVHQACESEVSEQQVQELVTDFGRQLQEEGVDTRIERVGRIITHPEHQHEVLRIAALLAHVSGGGAAAERRVLEKLTRVFMLPPQAVQNTLSEVQKTLALEPIFTRG